MEDWKLRFSGFGERECTFLFTNKRIFTIKIWTQECPASPQRPGIALQSTAPMEEMQSMFRCTIKQDHIAARLNLGPTFQKRKLSVLLQGQLVDQMEILPELEDSNSEEDVNNPESATDSTMGWEHNYCLRNH